MDAPAPALSHNAGPFYPRTRKREGKPCNMHPDVLAGVDTSNEGNKRKLSESGVAVDNNSVDMMEMN
jgi:hypothetical protein